MKGAKRKFNHEEAIELYLKGTRIADLARKYGVSASAIRSVFQRHGVMPQTREDLT